MKKMGVVLLAVIVALLVVSIPALAGPPENADGYWNYWIVDMGPEKQAGCNTFMPVKDEGIFTGTFAGTEEEVGMLVFHCNGQVSFKGILTFTGTVDGSDPGTMEMRILGRSTPQGWEGKWVILSGTGGLATLRGQGTIDVTGRYTGHYHFEPD